MNCNDSGRPNTPTRPPPTPRVKMILTATSAGAGQKRRRVLTDWCSSDSTTCKTTQMLLKRFDRRRASAPAAAAAAAAPVALRHAYRIISILSVWIQHLNHQHEMCRWNEVSIRRRMKKRCWSSGLRFETGDDVSSEALHTCSGQPWRIRTILPAGTNNQNIQNERWDLFIRINTTKWKNRRTKNSIIRLNLRVQRQTSSSRFFSI